MSKKNRQEQPSGKDPAPKPQSRLADYVWANLIFFGFLTLLSLVVWKSCESPTDEAPIKVVLNETFKFIVYLFGGGFLVVTLFDAAYDYFAGKAENEEPSPEGGTR